jgi:hypothetical protein
MRRQAKTRGGNYSIDYGSNKKFGTITPYKR